MKNIKKVYTRLIENDISSMANAVSFKLILGIFPFIIFLMTALSFFHLNIDSFIAGTAVNMPDQVRDILKYFIDDVVDVKSLSLLSTSLLLALYTASSAFHQMIIAINKIYDISDNRSFFKIRLLSFLLVVLYTAVIIFTMYGLIFGTKINTLILKLKIVKEIPAILVTFTNIFFSLGIIFLSVIILYRFSIYRKTTLKELMPGVAFTIAAWYVISKLFNIYVSNFSRYSVIYGSIGVVFIFALWINLLSYIILFGAKINCFIYEYRGGD